MCVYRNVREMSCKKRWLSKVYSDSQESKTDTNISWSNSDSEYEDDTQPSTSKRTKVRGFLQKSKSDNWLKLNITPPKQQMCYSVPSPRDDFLDSPVISEIKLEEQSPILTQKEPLLLKEQSPVIAHSRIIRRIKVYCKLKKENTIEDASSDSSMSQSQITIDNLTQTSPKDAIDNLTQTSPKDTVKISPAKSELSQPYRIDPFPSQHSSEVITDSYSSASDQRLLSYHQPAPRKKRFKKGSLASQLQKVVNSHTASVAIWQHEVFLTKSKGEEIQQDCQNERVRFKFVVMNKWREYGCVILECKCDDLQSNFSDLPIENYDTFILVPDRDNISNVHFESSHSYEICPPYCSKVVKHCLKNTICILNACRIVCV